MKKRPPKDSSLWNAARARRRLRVSMALFFFALAVPLAALLYVSARKLLQEAKLQERFAAEQTTEAIRKNLSMLLDVEGKRPFDDYSFYKVGNAEFGNQKPVQRSPLSEMAPANALPGLVGYFQIDADGNLSTPLLPARMNSAGQTSELNDSDTILRNAKLESVQQILRMAAAVPETWVETQRMKQNSAPESSNILRAPAPTGAIAAAKDAFSQKESTVPARINQEALLDMAGADAVPRSLGGAEGAPLPKTKASEFAVGNAAKLGASTAMRAEQPASLQKARTEFANEVSLDAAAPIAPPHPVESTRKSSADSEEVSHLSTPKITSFEAEIDPLQAVQLPQGFLLLFRKTWHGQKRIIQGAIVDTQRFYAAAIADVFSNSSLPPKTAISVERSGKTWLEYQLPELSSFESYSFSKRAASNKQQLDAYSPGKDASAHELLFATPLPEPLAQFNLAFYVPAIYVPAAAYFVLAIGAGLTVILLIGIVLLYRLSSAQISLAQKRNDFVSAVSHELRTPLTSIRMYGEMLRNGWVNDEAKKRTYYDYIFFESERLSRLISNVLKFSRLSGSSDQLQLQKRCPVDALGSLKEKVEHLAMAEHFTLRFSCAEDLAGTSILIDDDALAQIAINLVDNAIKFSKDAENKEIEIGFAHEISRSSAVLYVRDFGPGVASREQRKIFELFYRSESEMTRKTTGSGIGLALVKELALGMGATVNYRGRDPGSEFQVIFPLTQE